MLHYQAIICSIGTIPYSVIGNAKHKTWQHTCSIVLVHIVFDFLIVEYISEVLRWLRKMVHPSQHQ